MLISRLLNEHNLKDFSAAQRGQKTNSSQITNVILANISIPSKEILQRCDFFFSNESQAKANHLTLIDVFIEKPMEEHKNVLTPQTQLTGSASFKEGWHFEPVQLRCKINHRQPFKK